MDLDTIRAIIGLGPSDEALQAALDAALEALDNRYGPNTDDESGGGSKTEYLRPFGQWVRLGRRATEVTSVLEGNVEVDEEDYVLWHGGKYVRRLSSLAPIAWSAHVEVEYVPQSEARDRDRVTVALVNLELTNPASGLTGITVGPWSEQYADRGPTDYAAARASILGSLRPASGGVW